MPPDLPGVGVSGGVPLPSSAPLRPTEPSRALVPVARPSAKSPPGTTPLDRSGVALDDLLFAPDVVETREAVTPVAMEMGLESSRRQLLQRLPAEALVSLDAIWSAAGASEEGWYLRSGALTVLGHPQEGDRVAGEGLDTQPQSLALRLVQSVARALVGDLSGARAALYPALEQAPHDPVLLAQQAVVLARQGHDDDAADLLEQMAADNPEHPALVWARGAVRVASADRTRSAARPAAHVMVHVDEAWPMPEDLRDRPAVEGIGAPAYPAQDDDVLAATVRRLGASLLTRTDESITDEVRTALRACSAGGALASVCTPAESHAARQLFSALLVVLRGGTPGMGPGGTAGAAGAAGVVDAQPLTTVLAQLVPLLRAATSTSESMARSIVADARDFARDDAERMLRRLGAAVPPHTRQLLALLIRGARDASGRASVERRATPSSANDVMDDRPQIGSMVPDDADLGPLVPVRLGLALLGETSQTRALERRQEVLDATLSSVTTSTPNTGSHVMPGGSAELEGSGWGAARAAAAGERPAEGTGAGFPAILLTAGAVGAAVNGATAVAVVLAGAALWLSLRRPRREGRADTGGESR